MKISGCWLWFVLMLLICPATMARSIINIGLDEALPLQYRTAIDTVFIANSDIADYQILKGNRLVVFGKEVGSTSLLILAADGKTIDSKTLVVNKSLAHIRQQLMIRFPGQSIDVLNLGDQVVLSGNVPSEQMKRDIYRLVGELLEKEVTTEKRSWVTDDKTFDLRFLTEHRYHGIVNNIEVEEVKQVNVKLTVAEVSHSFMRQLGFRWGSVQASASGDGVFLGNGHFLDMVGNISSSDIARYISAADDDTMGQVLAEPNLSVISGETASFLAGGEMPIVTILNDTQSITYKEFGIRLELAAEVLKDDKINLSMQPEVSAIDSQVAQNTLNIPAFKTRRARTTVQLGDGESFVLGGLLNSEEREALSKIPLIGDIPILGSLFRHTTTERQKTELIIVATVNLVKPVQPGTVQIPQMQLNNSLLHYFNLMGPEHSQRYNKARLILSAGGFKE
ncbi:general secretion pathway protein GspD [Endozoicomonas montiporae]|uniref:General secretion pathway protein GspD n=1 Tax=Endozoicomonas montiporae TaxID=1027273 RepID=A0A081N735_9GAMM|nr:general secretion pathway protein GspD [Endozoicomonas montiporae]